MIFGKTIEERLKIRNSKIADNPVIKKFVLLPRKLDDGRFIWLEYHYDLWYKYAGRWSKCGFCLSEQQMAEVILMRDLLT